MYAPWQYNDNGTFSGRLTDVDELNIGNPLALTGEDVPELDKYRFNLNLRPSYQITDRLEVAALFGISYDKENETYLYQITVFPMSRCIPTGERFTKRR